MKVSSPVGTYPFEPRRLRLHRGGFTLEGSMGAWPATIKGGYRDAAAVVALVPPVPFVLRALSSRLGRTSGGRRHSQTSEAAE